MSEVGERVGKCILRGAQLFLGKSVARIRRDGNTVTRARVRVRDRLSEYSGEITIFVTGWGDPSGF